jgi:hypothetical protein
MLASSLITAKCWLKKKAHLNRCAFLIEAVTNSCYLLLRRTVSAVMIDTGQPEFFLSFELHQRAGTVSSLVYAVF